jgi:hypothetical protein
MPTWADEAHIVPSSKRPEEARASYMNRRVPTKAIRTTTPNPFNKQPTSSSNPDLTGSHLRVKARVLATQPSCGVDVPLPGGDTCCI